MKQGSIRFYYFAVLIVVYVKIYAFNYIGNFSLTERSGEKITGEMLKGKICIFNFIFTRCATYCPLMSQQFSIMQDIIGKYKNVYLISITGDPEFDNTKVLQEFANKYGAKNRWLFLTGDKETIYNLSINKFQLGLKKATPQELKEGTDIIMHSTKFILVDEKGKIRGYYDSKEQKSIQKLYEDLDKLVKKRDIILQLPTINAVLNGLSAILLLLGFISVKTSRIKLHKIFMISAFCTSILFLISYLIYHYRVGSAPFKGKEITKYIYFGILTTHSILATIIVPLSVITIFLGLKHAIKRHKKIASITLPLWLYVSISGIAVYMMLYCNV